MNPLKLLNAFDRGLAKIETALLVLLVLFLLGFAFLQVVLRNIFDSGIAWADIFNRSMVLWVGFFGATLSAREDRHLSLEVLTKFLPNKFKPFIQFIVTSFVIGVCALLTYYSYLFYVDQITFESSDLLFEGFPKAYFTVIFPLGFAVLTFRYVVKWIENLAPSFKRS